MAVREFSGELDQPKVREFTGQLDVQQAGMGGLDQRANELLAGANRGAFGLLDLPFALSSSLSDLMARGVGKISPRAEELMRTPIPGISPNVARQPFTSLVEAAVPLAEPQDATGRILHKIGEFGGAGLLPTGALAGLGKAGIESASPLINSMLKDAGRSVPKFLERELAATASAGAGAGAANELFPGNPLAEVAGALTPAGLKMAGGAAVRGAFRGGEQGRQAVQRSIDDFADAGTTPSVGQATGSPALQGVETIAGKSPGGVTTMRNAAQKTAQDIGTKIDELASGLSKQSGAEVAGRTIEKGIKGGFVSRFMKKGGQLYSKLNKFVPDDAQVAMSNTQKTLDDLVGTIEGAPSLSSGSLAPAERIIKIRTDLIADTAATGALPYEAVKALRTKIGNLLNSSEIITKLPRQDVKRLYGALSEDMRIAAEAAGPKALKTFERANKFWASGTNRIDDILEKVTNRAAPEKIFQAATAGKEGGTVVRSVMRSLKPDEQAVVASTVLRRMGRARNSAQNGLGEVFSVETFLTNWNALSKEAKTALFAKPNFGTLSKDLDQVAKVASRIREGSRVLANPSGTAGQTANIAAIGGGIGGAVSGSVAVPLSIAAFATANKAAAELLTNPNFVKWLAKSTRIAPERMPGHIARLSAIAFDDEQKEAVQEYLSALQQP